MLARALSHSRSLARARSCARSRVRTQAGGETMPAPSSTAADGVARRATKQLTTVITKPLTTAISKPLTITVIVIALIIALVVAAVVAHFAVMHDGQRLAVRGPTTSQIGGGESCRAEAAASCAVRVCPTRVAPAWRAPCSCPACSCPASLCPKRATTPLPPPAAHRCRPHPVCACGRASVAPWSPLSAPAPPWAALGSP